MGQFYFIKKNKSNRKLIKMNTTGYGNGIHNEVKGANVYRADLSSKTNNFYIVNSGLYSIILKLQNKMKKHIKM